MTTKLDASDHKETVAPLAARVSADERAVIEHAVEILGTNLSTFVRETVIREAKDVVVDQRVIPLSDEDWNWFLEKLDEPPQENKRLADLLSRKAPWESGS